MSRTTEPPGIDDTIAAISTPPGEGGIGIVRLSGPRSCQIVKGIFVSPQARDIRQGPQRVFHGDIQDKTGVLDEVLVHVMRAPHSYTKEDVVEINCHGGAAPLNAILELVLDKGARLAEPGEFTKRAFLSGRIDLVQAESVIDRIRAQTRQALRAASAASHGTLSKSIHEIRDSLIQAKAQIEAAVDFPDDDLPECVTPELKESLEDTRRRMTRLLDTAEAGRLYREGAAVALAGRTNVGKSSLFNALLRESRAIVTRQAGTTRDLLEESVVIQGIPVRLIDMAGLRETHEEVERIGVTRARQALHEVAAILLVFDVSQPLSDDDRALAEDLLCNYDTPVLAVLNKIDIADAVPRPEWDYGFAGVAEVSAKTGEGLDTLESAMASLLLQGAEFAPDQGMITRIHQKDSLRRAIEGLDAVLSNFDASPEFLSMDLEEALKAVGEITGETTPDELLDIIFGSFCIGK